MEKDEFLKLLRISLSGRLPQKGIEESVSFYEDYIDIRLRSGEEKEALFSRLGDPRLIARSILEANNAKGDTSKKPSFLTRFCMIILSPCVSILRCPHCSNAQLMQNAPIPFSDPSPAIL